MKKNCKIKKNAPEKKLKTFRIFQNKKIRHIFKIYKFFKNKTFTIISKYSLQISSQNRKIINIIDQKS